MEDVELAAGKVNGLTQHGVGLVVAVHAQHCGHDVQEPARRSGRYRPLLVTDCALLFLSP